MITENIINLYLTYYKGCDIIIEDRKARIHDNLLNNDFYIHSFRADEWIRAFKDIGALRACCL